MRVRVIGLLNSRPQLRRIYFRKHSQTGEMGRTVLLQGVYFGVRGGRRQVRLSGATYGTTKGVPVEKEMTLRP